MKKPLLLLMLAAGLNSSFGQVQLSSYPYRQPQWIYLQRFVDHFQNPPDTSWYLLTICGCGNVVYNNYEYLRVYPMNYGTPQPHNYQHYRQSGDSLISPFFYPGPPTVYSESVNSYYGASPGGIMSDLNDTVQQIWTTTLLNGDLKRTFDTKNAQYQMRDTVIEDIGYVHSPWFGIAYTMVAPDITRLVSFRDSSSLLYYYDPAHIDPSLHAFLDTGNYQPCPTSLVSLQEQTNGTQLSAYFSPANNELFITNGLPEKNAIVEMRDLQGRLIEQRAIEGQQAIIPIRNYPAGIYLYIVRNGTMVKSGKFVVTKQE